jgi:hypothetical protein
MLTRGGTPEWVAAVGRGWLIGSRSRWYRHTTELANAVGLLALIIYLLAREEGVSPDDVDLGRAYVLVDEADVLLTFPVAPSRDLEEDRQVGLERRKRRDEFRHRLGEGLRTAGHDLDLTRGQDAVVDAWAPLTGPHAGSYPIQTWDSYPYSSTPLSRARDTVHTWLNEWGAARLDGQHVAR